MKFFEFDTYTLLSAFIIVFAIQIIMFFIAAFFKTDKLTDISYGSTFFLLSIIYLFKPSNDIRTIIVLLCVILWSIRISAYLFYRILKIGKDERFDDKRGNFWSFAKFWLFQAIAVYILSIPFIFLANTDSYFAYGSIFDYLGLILFFSGLIIETIADMQKFSFKLKNKNKWIDSGLWKYSRHPNYFGEILLWYGIYFQCLTALSGWQLFISLVSPLCITYILVKVSGVPLLESSNEKKYKGDPDYQKYKERTNLLIPWFSKI